MANGSGTTGTTRRHNQTVPQDPFSEEAIACALLTHGSDALAECGRLEERHFLDARFRAIFGAARRLGPTADHALIAMELADRGELEMVGGNAGLNAIAFEFPVSRLTAKHAQSVWEHWRRRRILGLVSDIGTATHRGDRPRNTRPHCASWSVTRLWKMTTATHSCWPQTMRSC